MRSLLLAFTQILIVLAIALCIALNWCPPSRAEQNSAEDFSFFETKIRPLLVERCHDCHTGDDPESGLALDSLSGLLKGGLRGPAIVIGKPEESLLIRALRHGEILKMPAKEKLSPRVIADFATWIKAGAAWPDAEPVSIAESAHDEVEFTEQQKTFWAFRSPRQGALPIVDDNAWARTPIDAFILSQLESAGLQPAPPAIKRVLIRRATFDLHGLPPTPAEVDAFLADQSPNSYRKLIDRLLSSPRYGERWGRHWLDVARYADSNGMDENLAFANAFRYRDYVIAALNKDKPFHWFVQEQIAGDLLDNEQRYDWHAPYEGTVATGFLALGAKMLAEDDPVKMQMDIIDEQIDTLGRAFLGMTLGCARCHDHKFDPIPTADYYALAGVFKSTKTMENYNVVARWQEKPLASAEVISELAKHKQRIAAKQAEIDQLQKAANELVLSEARQHVGDYLLAATALQRQDNLIATATIHGDQPDLAAISNALLIEADEFDRGNVLRDRTNWGKGIGVLVNAGETPNFAEYDIDVPQAGLYQLEIRVAAAASRPTQLMINGRLAKADAAREVTGDWHPAGQKWFVEGFYYLNAGQNLIRLEQPQFFPHIDKLLFVPAPPEAFATSPDQFLSALAADPPEGVVLVEAETIARGNLEVVTEGYGEGIGIIGGPGGLNEGELDIEIPAAGKYRIAFRYAAQDSRPTNLIVNQRGVNARAIGASTGSWYPETQRWFLEGRAELLAGKNTIRLQRDGPIPHIDKIMLIAESQFRGDANEFAPLGEYETIPEFVRQWSEYLQKTKSDPAAPLAAWHAAVARQDSLRELATDYNRRAVGDSLLAVLHDPQGPLRVSDKIEIYYPLANQQQLTLTRAEKQKLDETTPTFPETMAVSDATAENVRIHIRGSHLTQGREVPRRVPRIFTRDSSTPFDDGGSGRLELAGWIASSDNPLTARVIANRIWQWHFGAGLVRSPDNFGSLGLRPTHPELLDWLAVHLVESGWSIKQLHRTIMLSSSYRMSTQFDQQAARVDPENKLWWRFSRRRAEAESIRDSILAAAGQLDLSMGGSLLPTANRAYVTSTANVDPVAYVTNRRSVYMPVVRSALFEAFQAFDFADPSFSAGQRQSTTVAPQALFMMNSKIVAEATRQMAAQLLETASDDSSRVNNAYRLAYGRSPSELELQRALKFVNEYTAALLENAVAPTEARIKSWQSLCRVILSANEFIYIE